MRRKEKRKMNENTIATRGDLSELAGRMVQRYVRGLLSVDDFVERLKRVWQENYPGETPGGPALESLARGLCSKALYEACRLPGGRLREVAFARLNEYLEWMLRDMGATMRYAAGEVREEVIQQTFVEILQSLQRERGRLERPQAFLGWVRVILRRQLTHYWRQRTCVELLSLESEDDLQFAELVDEQALDPLAVEIWRELRAELRAAIANLHNPKYREVLLKIYYSELKEREVALLLQVPVADIYLWHHRAIQALHKQANVPAKRRRV